MNQAFIFILVLGLSLGSAQAVFRRQEAKNMQVSYQSPHGQISAESLFLVNGQDQIFEMNPFQGQFSLQEGKLLLQTGNDSFATESIFHFLDDFLMFTLRGLNFHAEEEVFDLQWNKLEGTGKGHTAHAGALSFHCQGEMMEELDKFGQACLFQGISTLSLSTFGVEGSRVEALRPLLALDLGDDYGGHPKGLLPTCFRNIRAKVEKGKFQVLFDTDAFFSIGGVVEGSLLQKKEKGLLIIHIESASMGIIPIRPVLFKLLSALNDNPQVHIAEPEIILPFQD